MRVPLRIQDGVTLDGDGRAGRLSQAFVQIPTAKGVAGTVRSGGRYVRGGVVLVGAALHVAAAVGLVGQGVVLARVFDKEFLLGLPIKTGGRNDSGFGNLKFSVVESLHRRGDVAVQDALDVRRAVNLGVAVAFKVLQQVDEVIHCRVRHELDANGNRLVRIEHVLGHFDSGRFGIVNGRAGDLIGVGLRGGRRDEDIGKIAGLGLQQVGVEDDFLAGGRSADVVILSGDAVDVHGTEHGNSSDGAVDHGFGGHFGVSAFDDPLLEDLTCHEGVLRHGADGLAVGAEVLRKLLDGGAIIRVDDEAHFVFVFEFRHDGHIGGHGFAADDGGVTVNPLHELLALHHGGGGES